MRHGTLLTAVAGLLAIVWSGAAIAQNISTLAVMRNDDAGQYLADSGERPVYIHSGDEQGSSGKPAVSNCFDECAAEVPPLFVDEAPDAGKGVEESLIGTIRRAGGPKQVTYNGWPLYRPIRASEDIQDPGEDWHRIRPTGEPIE